MKDIEGIDRVVEHLRPHMKDIDAHFDKENNYFKALLAEDHDLMGRVLKCHLIIEHYLERFITAHYRIGNKDLVDSKLSFFQKAKLLPDARTAASFVKPGVLRLNTIRNEFGHTLRPVVRSQDLGAINECLAVMRKGIQFRQPIEAIEAFTTVAATFLVVPPPELQKVFIEAFAEVRVHAP